MPKKYPRPGDDDRRRAVGGRIRAARYQAGIGLREMARELGMSSSWLNSVELGLNGIDVSRLSDVANYLHLPVSHFLAEPEPPAPVYRRQQLSRPMTRLDWRLMYRDDEARAKAHYELDQVFRRMEEKLSDRARPAEGD